MAGRTPIKVYEYNFQGEYIDKYDNIQEARVKHYSNIEGKMPMFRDSALGLDYTITPNDTILYKQRVGRDTTKLLIKVINSSFHGVSEKDDIPIVMTDLEGNLLATFVNIKAASLIIKDVNYNILYSRLSKKSKAIKPGTEYYLNYLED